MNLTLRSTGTVQQQWIEAIQRGDHASFVLMVRCWETRMLQTAVRIVGSYSDAEEIRQVVLLRILQFPENLPNADHFPAWIRRCVINESLRYLRQKRTEHGAKQQFANGRAEAPVNPADQAQMRDDIDQLTRLMAHLPPEQRALLSLRYDDNLTIRQIAEVVNQPRATVHKHLTKAIRFLHRNMTK